MTRIIIYSSALVAFVAGMLLSPNRASHHHQYYLPYHSQTHSSFFFHLLLFCEIPRLLLDANMTLSIPATAMTVASIAIPKWVSYSVTTPRGDTFTKHVGLQKSCSSLDTPPCRNFPSAELCRDSERYFCSMWRTVGFMAFLATILSLACLVSFVVIMRGGKYERERGWPFTSGLLVLIATFELTIISIVVRQPPLGAPLNLPSSSVCHLNRVDAI